MPVPLYEFPGVTLKRGYRLLVVDRLGTNLQRGLRSFLRRCGRLRILALNGVTVGDHIFRFDRSEQLGRDLIQAAFRLFSVSL